MFYLASFFGEACGKMQQTSQRQALFRFFQEKEVAVFASSQKGGRHWLKVRAAGKNWYWHRLVAWCFCNPRNLTWETYHKKDGRTYRYQAGHLSLSEVDCRVANLLVMTTSRNKAMYKEMAKRKHGRVFRG